MNQLKYLLDWQDGKVLIQTEQKSGAMAKLFLGPPNEAQIALNAWKTGVNAAGMTDWSPTRNFDWRACPPRSGGLQQQQKTPLCLTFHTDPGHGWLEVPKSMVPPELKGKISRYSYQDDNNYYLEEDCDAAPVLDFLKLYYQVSTTEKHHPNEAPMRGYRRA